LTKVNARRVALSHSGILADSARAGRGGDQTAEASTEVKVQLLVSASCAPCDQAEKVWREVAAECALDFSVVDLGGPEGQALAERLRLRTIPALVIDGRLIAIGVQSPEEARALVRRPPGRT
jgi:thioredoxin-like negative regulator of GroEL